MLKFRLTIWAEIIFWILGFYIFNIWGASINSIIPNNVEQTLLRTTDVPRSMKPKIENVTDSVVMGEGPHWDVKTQTLYHVDVFGKHLVRYTPSTNQYIKVSVAPKTPSFIIPIEGRPNYFIISLDNEVVVIEWNNTNKFIIKKNLYDLDSTISGNRINDAKCDSDGRLWAGTIGTTGISFDDWAAVGNLFVVNSVEKPKTVISNLRIANGLAWNYEIAKMYYIDSWKGTIDQYDFDGETGEIINGTTLFTLKKHFASSGAPDGMTIDTEGNLWVAIFGGQKVIQIDGKQPETLLQVIIMPVEEVTSLIFGGANLDELYVTTGALPIHGKKLLPPNGATFRITGTGYKGFPGVNFKWT